jgi:SAM-dependent methyltransferase
MEPSRPTYPRKLNLGCGAFKKSGYLNVDVNPQQQPDVVYDLNRYPYPFPDGCFTVVEADHVLEHLEDPFQALREWHRILAHEGLLLLKVPHFSRGFTNSDHRRGFDVSLPYYLMPSFTPGYIGVEFRLKALRLVWFAQPHLKRTVLSAPTYYLGLALGGVLDLLANMAPWLCSRWWCFLVGGFEEIEFRFVCQK